MMTDKLDFASRPVHQKSMAMPEIETSVCLSLFVSDESFFS